MKSIFLFIFVVSFSTCFCQSRQTKIILRRDKQFEISDEDKVIHYSDKQVAPDTTRADLDVNHQQFRRIWFANAKLKEHDLEILIHTTSPAYHQEYLISISRDKYRIKYNFKTSGDQFDRTIKIDKTILELNSLVFKKGDTIRGYTELHGKCVYKESDYPTEILDIRGNFKFIIK